MARMQPAAANAHASLDLQRYTIAQMFHELIRCGRETKMAAEQVAWTCGVSANEVFNLAAIVRPEPLWRL